MTPSVMPAASSCTFLVMSMSCSRAVERTSMVFMACGSGPRPFQLHGHMRDPEILEHLAMDLLQDPLILLRLLYHCVSAHGEIAAGHGPDMQIVNVVDAGNAIDGFAQFGEVDVSGC